MVESLCEALSNCSLHIIEIFVNLDHDSSGVSPVSFGTCNNKPLEPSLVGQMWHWLVLKLQRLLTVWCVGQGCFFYWGILHKFLYSLVKYPLTARNSIFFPCDQYWQNNDLRFLKHQGFLDLWVTAFGDFPPDQYLDFKLNLLLGTGRGNQVRKHRKCSSVCFRKKKG